MTGQQRVEPSLVPAGVLIAPGAFGRTRLAAEVIGIYVRVRWLLARRGAERSVAAIRGELSEHATNDSDQLRVVRGRRLGGAVVRVLRLLPTDSRCLMRSLVLTGLLANRGVYAKVVIGVRPEPAFGAHAWVEVDGQPLLAANEATFQRLVEL